MDVPFPGIPKLSLTLAYDEEISTVKEHQDDENDDQKGKVDNWKHRPATIDEVHKLFDEWRAFCPTTPDSDINLDMYRGLFQEWKGRGRTSPSKYVIEASNEGYDEVDGGAPCDSRKDPELSEEVNKVIQEWRGFNQSTARSEIEFENYKDLLRQWKRRISSE